MFPRWLSWLMLGFLGYLVVLGNARQKAGPVPDAAAPVEAAAQAELPALRAALDVERWKRAINPDYAKRIDCTLPISADGQLPIAVAESTPGAGNPAQCGDTIRMELTIWNSAGHIAYQDKFELLLGARVVASGLDYSLVGLRPNGVRTLVLPPAALAHAAHSPAPKDLLAALPAKRTAIVTVTRLPDQP